MRAAWLLLVPVAAGCVGDIDPPWQLDHERIVAVRATPPHIPSGATSTLDALLAHKGAPTEVVPPTTAFVSPLAPVALQGSVVAAGAGWTVVAPGEDALATARIDLMLDPGAPVPLLVGLTFGSGADALVATKFVYLGDAADNPTLGTILVAGAPPPAAIVVPPDVDVPLSIDAPDTFDVNWLTSCGTMHDDNEPSAFVHVLPADPMTGELAVVVRDTSAGVAFQTWPISTGN